MPTFDIDALLPTTNPCTKSVNASTPLLSRSHQRSTGILEPSSELYGIFLMALSSIGFSGMAFFTHIAEEKYNFSPASTLFVRGSIHSIATSLYIAWFLGLRGTFHRLSSRQRLLLIVRGGSGAFGLICMFNALQKLPVGDAVAIFFCSPVIIMLLSGAILGEPITGLHCFAAVASFGGILLIARPGFNDETGIISKRDRIIGSLAAFASAWFNGFEYVIVRGLGTSIHFMTSVLALSIASVIASIPLGGPIGLESLLGNREGTANIMLSVLFAFLAQVCANKGLQYCRAGPGGLTRNLDVPISYLLGLLFLGEKPSWLSSVGSCIVLSATFMIALQSILARGSPSMDDTGDRRAVAKA